MDLSTSINQSIARAVDSARTLTVHTERHHGRTRGGWLVRRFGRWTSRRFGKDPSVFIPGTVGSLEPGVWDAGRVASSLRPSDSLSIPFRRVDTPVQNSANHCVSFLTATPFLSLVREMCAARSVTVLAHSSTCLTGCRHHDGTEPQPMRYRMDTKAVMN